SRPLVLVLCPGRRASPLPAARPAGLSEAGATSVVPSVVHGDSAIAERLRRDQIEASGAGQPALVQGGAMTADHRMDEEHVLVDQVQSVQLGRKRAATHEYAIGSAVLECLHRRAQVAGQVVATRPGE